jgi:glycosyltransferase involved in cell wall biosynthesis
VISDPKRLRIALVNALDSRDRRIWSGTNYYIAQALQKHCGDVSYIGPIAHDLEKALGTMFSKSARLLSGKRYMSEVSFLFARRFAHSVAQQLSQASFDVIVAPRGVTETALLQTDIPVVLVDDTTFPLLYNYDPNWFDIHPLSRREMQHLQHLAVHKASMLIYSSAWAARSAVDQYHVDREKIHIVPFGANFEEPPAREVALSRKKSSQRCRLLLVGVNWDRKGGDIAVETLLKLEEMGIASELIICGTTPPTPMSHPHITFLPFLDKNNEQQRKQLEQLYLTSDFFLFPTRNECFGIVSGEANAYGLPVITTDTGGVPEVVRNGDNGFLLPLSARGDAYASIIASLYQDDQRYAELSLSSRTAFEQRLNWDSWGRTVNHLLSTLLKPTETIDDIQPAPRQQSFIEM